MPVRLTLHPGEDVELPEGARLGDLRAPLADLVRRPELWHARLEADGAAVGDDAVVGRRPLLPGATLRVVGADRRHREDPDVAALRSPWLVASTTGPDAGETLPLAPGRPVVVGGSARGVTVRTDARGRVRLRSHRVSPSWFPVGDRRARTRPEAATVRVDRGRERRRRLGPLRRRWRPGTLLEVTGRRYALHRSGDVATWLAPSSDGPSTTPAVSTAMLLTGTVPVLGAIGLAVMLRQPLYALFSLVAVVALVPQVVAVVRRRRASTAEAPDVRTPGARPAGAAPWVTAARVVAAHQASDVAWHRALETLAGRGRSGAQRAVPAPARSPRDLLPDGALAVRGPTGAARAVARAVVVDLAATGASVQVVGGGHGAWDWCRWLTPGHDGAAPEPSSHLLVVDDPDPEALAVADDAVRRGHAVVLCLPHEPGGREVPAPSWCRAVVRVAPDGLVHRTAPDGTDSTEPGVGVTPSWAGRAARRLAGLGALRRSLTDLDDAESSGQGVPSGAERDGSDVTAAGLPAVVALGDLLDGADPAQRWADATGWRVPLGVDATGDVVELDLVGDGPHLLVAGTTGSGKSELLQSLVLGLALTRSPADLALALVDFKGGASFGRCADLPHVVGQVTDLEPGLAGRALAGLRAELGRRERVLAEHRAASLDDAPPGTLPRLVVVIDEFRALADDLPDFLPGLLRVAAQGRSLGVHLVLATQRPSGAVSTDVRANVSARIALRVVDAADSHDVVGTAAAAAVPLGAPGRAVLRIGSGAPVALQCAHAGTVPDGGGPVVRRAAAWRPEHPAGADRPGCGRAADDGGPVADGASASATAREPVAATVEAARSAADRLGLRPGPAPWLPPLPVRVIEADVPPRMPTSDDEPGALPLALADDPGSQRRLLVRWHPRTGHLAVVGATRSGRTTTLVSLAAAALARGWHVHVLAPGSAVPAFDGLSGHPGLGTVTGPDDPRRARRLLGLLDRPRSSDGGEPTLVVVDRVEELRAALVGRDASDPLVSALATSRVAFALSADSAAVGGVAARVGPRLVLLGTDQHDDVMRGAPAGLAGTGGTPGRAAWLTTGTPLGCQVLLPSVPPAGGGAPPLAGPVRVEPLPARVPWADLAEVRERAGTGAAGEQLGHGSRPVVVGVGDDAAVPVALDVAQGALVVGPRGSGRTTVLRTVVRSLVSACALAAVVSRDPALRAEPGDHVVSSASPSSVRRLVEGLSAAHDGGDRRSRSHVVVDDLDMVAQACPVEAERLAMLAEDGGVVLVASATTQGALMAHRGPLAELRARRHGVVLGAGGRDADEVLGTPLDEFAEGGPGRAGRGVLVDAGRARALQAAGP